MTKIKKVWVILTIVCTINSNAGFCATENSFSLRPQMLFSDPFKKSTEQREALIRTIKKDVLELGYAEEVADIVANFFLSMQYENGNYVLLTLKSLIDEYKNQPTGGEFSELEVDLIIDLVNPILQLIKPEDDNTKNWDLSEIIKNRKATCIGYTQLFYILASAIGFEVLPAEAQLKTEDPKEIWHYFSFIKLSDGRYLIADLVNRRLSKPFLFNERFQKKEDYWIPKKTGPATQDYNSYYWIRTGDKRSLSAAVYYQRGHLPGDRNMRSRFFMLQEAYRLDPLSIAVNSNLGDYYMASQDTKKAIQHFTYAIELMPESCSEIFLAELFLKRGVSYMLMGIAKEAQEDIKIAEKLDPRNIGKAERLFSRLEQAGFRQLRRSL